MSWSRYFWLGDLGQQLDLEGQRAAAARARRGQWSKDQTQDEQIAALQDEVSKLKTYVGGLCQLLIQHRHVAAEELDRLAESVYAPPAPPASPAGEQAPDVDPALAELERAPKDQGGS